MHHPGAEDVARRVDAVGEPRRIGQVRLQVDAPHDGDERHEEEPRQDRPDPAPGADRPARGVSAHRRRAHRSQVWMMTLRKFQPYRNDFGFLDSPPARARNVTGTSTTRAWCPERLDQDLARPELILLQDHLLEEIGASGAIPRRRVGDPLPGEDGDHAGEHVHAEVADQTLPFERAEQPRSVHVVRFIREDRRDHDRDLLRQMLAVRIQRDDHLRAEAERDLVADAERQPPAAPDGQLRDERAGLTGNGRRAIGGPIAHDDRDDVVTLDHPGDLLHHGGDVLRLVERRGDRDQPRAVRQAWQPGPNRTVPGRAPPRGGGCCVRSYRRTSARAGTGRREPRRRRAGRRSRRRFRARSRTFGGADRTAVGRSRARSPTRTDRTG